MVTKNSLFLLTLVACTLFQMQVHAQEITPEDLPSESVLPKLDSPAAVKNRTLRFNSRFEVGLNQAWILDEPFSKNTSQVLELGYGLSERRSVGVKLTFFNTGNGDYGNQFENFGTKPQFSEVPQARLGYGVFLHERIMYGKWSFSQEVVYPTTIEALYEADLVNWKIKTLFGAAVGLSQKTYFTKNFAFGLSYKLLMRQWIDPNSVDIKSTSSFEASDFKAKFRLNHDLALKLSWIF